MWNERPSRKIDVTQVELRGFNGFIDAERTAIERVTQIRFALLLCIQPKSNTKGQSSGGT
jgi:hypothetical protein